MTEIRYGRGYVYSIEYRIVWRVKYWHKVLVEKVDARLKEILHQVVSDYGFTISEMESNLDHIHLLIECTPQHSIPNMVKVLKGISAVRRK